jgi:hypothetical protein
MVEQSLRVFNGLIFEGKGSGAPSVMMEKAVVARHGAGTTRFASHRKPDPIQTSILNRSWTGLSPPCKTCFFGTRKAQTEINRRLKNAGRIQKPRDEQLRSVAHTSINRLGGA